MDYDAKSVREYYLRPEIVERMFEIAEDGKLYLFLPEGCTVRGLLSVQFPETSIHGKEVRRALSLLCRALDNPLLLSNTMKQADIEKIRTRLGPYS